MDRKSLYVNGIKVDIDALLRIRHYCDPMLCREGPCCCHEYEVAFPKKELRHIVGLVPEAGKYAEKVLPGAAHENPFDEDGSGTYILDTDESGKCVFAFQDKVGCTWCALHRVALDHHLTPHKHKPSPCSLWPLALTEDTPPVLTVQDDILRYPCIWMRKKAKKLYPDIADCIRRVFGDDFLLEINEYLNNNTTKF